MNRSQPVYIIKLGSGSGRFAFHFLKRYRGFLTDSVLRDIPVKYVMTDLAQRRIDPWPAEGSRRHALARLR